MKLEDIAREILKKYPIYKQMKASISGKHHIGETQKEHLDLAYNIACHLCKEFNVTGNARDKILCAILLHDIGLYVITKKGKVNIKGWDYFPETGYSRNYDLMKLHPVIGAVIADRELKEYGVSDTERGYIKRCIASHMSHWYKDTCPEPDGTLEVYIVCTSDYIASKGKAIFEKKE